MNRFRPYLLVLLLFFNACRAQQPVNVQITGQVIADSTKNVAIAGTSMRLVPYKQGGNSYPGKVGADGTFTITIPVSKPELYELKYRGFKMDVLATPTEPVFRVVINVDSAGVNNMRATGSHEYDAYRAFKKTTTNFRDKLKEMIAGCNNNPANCAAQLKKEFNDYNGILAYMRHTYTGTFAASVLVPMAQMPDISSSQSGFSQLQKHFLDHINWDDSDIYNTPDVRSYLAFYIEDIADTSASARLSLISSLYEKAKNNEAQKELLAMLLFDFIDADRETYLQSLVQWESKHAELAKDQPVSDAKIHLIGKTIPGVKTPEVTGTDLNDKDKILSAVTKSNKLTLLIFWASDCPHCRHDMPAFIKLYERYHTKGLEIFGASIDTEKDKWKQFVNNNHLEWVNIVLPENSTAHADYFIQYTPTMVLIDNQSTIIHRFFELGDLERYVKEYLK